MWPTDRVELGNPRDLQCLMPSHVFGFIAPIRKQSQSFVAHRTFEQLS